MPDLTLSPLIPSHLGKLPKVAIIGGKGQMGKVFHRIFLSVDCEVSIVEEGQATSSIDYLGFDLVVVSVPIDKALGVIEEVAPKMSKDSLLMDITSLKAPFVKKMQELCVGAFLGTHPLFGPLEIIKGQKIAVMSEVNDLNNNEALTNSWLTYALAVFEVVGLKVLTTTSTAHDQAMGVVQSLIHFISIAFSATVTKQKEKGNAELSDLTTHYYLLHKNLAGRLLAQDPNLYADISFLNEDIVPILEDYQRQFGQLIDFLKNKDREKFVDFFNKASEKEPEKEKAYYKVERIMEYLADLEK